MNSLQSNRTLPQLLGPTLLNGLSGRSCALPSSAAESCSCLSGSLCCEEVGSECWTTGAEEGGCGGHFVTVPFLESERSIEDCPFKEVKISQ